MMTLELTLPLGLHNLPCLLWTLAVFRNLWKAHFERLRKRIDRSPPYQRAFQ